MWNQRPYIGGVHLNADGSGKFPRYQHVLYLLAPFNGHNVDRWPEFLHMLVARQHPRDAVQIHAVLMLENAARPHAGGDRVPTIDAHAFAFEIPRRADAAADVV